MINSGEHLIFGLNQFRICGSKSTGQFQPISSSLAISISKLLPVLKKLISLATTLMAPIALKSFKHLHKFYVLDFIGLMKCQIDRPPSVPSDRLGVAALTSDFKVLTSKSFKLLKSARQSHSVGIKRERAIQKVPINHC